MYYTQSIIILDVVALDNTNILPSNLVIMCICIVHDVVSLCVPFTSSFKVGKELFIVNVPSLQGSPKLHLNNFAVKISVCACVNLDISLEHKTAFMLPTA